MSIKKFALLATLALCLAFGLGDEVRAQEGAEEEPKWEVGTDLLNPFRKSTANPLTNTYGIIARRKHRENGAFRLRTNLAGIYGLNLSVKNQQAYLIGFSFDIGYEKRQRYGRLQHYYGADLSQRYSKLISAVGLGINGPSIDPLDMQFTRSTNKRRLYGLGFFNGFKYYLAERVSLSVESTINLYYFRHKDTSQQIDGNGTAVGPLLNNYYPDGFRVLFTPVTVLYLSYYF